MRMILPTLPVADVRASRAFFAALGFRFGEPSAPGDTACVIVAGGIRVMLVEERRHRAFVGRTRPRDDADGLLCISCDSRAQVRGLAARARDAGADRWRAPQDLGVLYGESFRDLDGHVWELLWMATEASPAAVAA